jgi:tRNA(fMet)-specific endonuclease VapC
VKYLLDTNAVIAVLKGQPRFLARLRRHRPHEFGLSVIVFHELLFGAYRSQRVVENLARIEALQFEVVDFDQEDARRAAEIRASLASAGSQIGPYDVLIAGQARERGLTLITHNIAEFSRVSGLRVSDWET